MFEYHGIKLTWLGHDGFRIENGGVIYVDPFKIETTRPKADLVLVTHEHSDHCSLDDLRKVVTASTVVVAHSQSKNQLSKLNVKEIKIVKPGDRISIGDVAIEAVSAYNINKFREPGRVHHPREDGKVGYVVTMNGVRIYHAGDTDNIPEMKSVQTDIALLPVSGTYVMTAKEAAEAAGVINPKIAIPMHYATIVGSAKDAETFQRLVKCEVKLLEKER